MKITAFFKKWRLFVTLVGNNKQKIYKNLILYVDYLQKVW